jgi:hypothetical protein
MTRFRSAGFKARFVAVAAASVLLLAGCSGGGGDDDEDVFIGTVRITGTAFLPRSADPNARETDVTPVANTPFIVIDPSLGSDAAPVASGITDADGNYDVEVPSAEANAVIVQGPVRVSGLVNPITRRINKDFDSATDIACEAGVTSVFDGSVPGAQLNGSRIRYLEDAAEIILSKRFVDFTNPQDVSLAAIQARALTNDGADAPREEDYDNVSKIK